MENISFDDKLILLQYIIEKYNSEDLLKEKLDGYFTVKEVERCIDTLIATQKVRRIGNNILQNNISHTGELPDIPSSIKEIIDKM